MYRQLFIIAALAFPHIAFADSKTDCRFTTRIDDAKGINFKCKESSGKHAAPDHYKSCKVDMVVAVGTACPDDHSVSATVSCLGTLDIEDARPGEEPPLVVKDKRLSKIKGNGTDNVKMTLTWKADPATGSFTKPEVSRLKCTVLVNDVLIN
jgi:hypothetical protein